MVKKTWGYFLFSGPRLIEDLQSRLRELESRLTDTYKAKLEIVTNMLNLKQEEEKLNSTIDCTLREMEALKSRINECELDITEKDTELKNLKLINEHLSNTTEDFKQKSNSFIKDNWKLQHENNDLLEGMQKL